MKNIKELPEETRERLFILELSKLSKKYDVIVDGCGCCGSPSVFCHDTKDIEGYSYDDRLSWCGSNERIYSYQGVVQPEDGDFELLGWTEEDHF